jgi:hypothetical protein
MPGDGRYTPGPQVHPAIGEELRRLSEEIREVEGQCDKRHDSYNGRFKCIDDLCVLRGQRLVTIAGEHGDNGKLAQLFTEVGDVKSELSKQRKLIIRVIVAALSTTAVATAITQALIYVAK